MNIKDEIRDIEILIDDKLAEDCQNSVDTDAITKELKQASDILKKTFDLFDELFAESDLYYTETAFNKFYGLLDDFNYDIEKLSEVDMQEQRKSLRC